MPFFFLGGGGGRIGLRGFWVESDGFREFEISGQ